MGGRDAPAAGLQPLTCLKVGDPAALHNDIGEKTADLAPVSDDKQLEYE
jgi:hypothetical protein